MKRLVGTTWEGHFLDSLKIKSVWPIISSSSSFPAAIFFIKNILIYSHFLIIVLDTKNPAEYFIHFSLFLATQPEESYFPDQGLNPGPQK